MKKSDHIATNLIHGGSEVRGDASKALNPPIYMTSTFTFDSIEHADKVMSFGSDDYVYTRGNNPTLRLFEQRMSVLEKGSGSIAFASGMAAISSTLLALASPGDTILIHKTLYGSSYTLATHLLPKWGIGYEATDLRDIESVKSILSENKVTAIYFETPVNPDLAIIDIAEISQLAHEYGAKVVVDNTFASPYLQNPLVLGADVVLHSTTKYICGHGDALGGVVTTKDEELALTIKFGYMCELGGVMSPFNAWLMIRGLKTLKLRMEQHCANAMKAAEYLENHPKVAKVYYPGLSSHQGHELCTKQMNGYGGIISFEIAGDKAAAIRCIDNFSMAKIAVSLGDCETLVQMPAAMTHRGYDPERLKEFGLTESMIRISIGIEDIDDIIADIERALEAV